MKKAITFFSSRAAMMLLTTLLLTLTAQTAWAQLPNPDDEGNVTITTPGTYTASGHIYGNLIINTSGPVILNVDDLTLDSDDDSNNYDRDILLENGTLTLNVSNDKSLKAGSVFVTTLTMTGGTISANNVGANTIDMSAGLIEAYSFDAGGTISGGTITVQNFYAGHNTGQDYITLTISGGTITANDTFYIFDLEINASTLGLSITANTYNYVYWDSNLSITNGYVTDGTNIYGSGDTYSESLKNYLQGNGGTTLTVAVVYTVTFDMCDGGGGDDDALVMYDHDMPTINLPTRDGYAFGGYFTATNGNGTQYYNADGTSTRTWNIANNATLYAKWTVVPHIVTSEMSGEWTTGTYNVTSNVTIDGGVTITGDVILNINSGCTLNIANGHIDAYSNQSSLTFNGPGTLSVADHINANTFNMTGGTINVDNICIAGSISGGTINAKFLDVAGTISGGTINVVNDFIAGKYSFVGGNDHYDDLTISGGTIETGSLYIVSLVIDANNSHSISIKANDYGFDYSGSLTINGTLYAGTTPLTGTLNSGISAYNGMYLRTESYSNTYTVNFNANGGSGTMSPQTFTVGVAQNLSTCTFTRNDHTFDGWATTQGGNVAYTDGQSVNNLTSAGGTVTLYAHWRENAAPVTTYTVTFDKNGGSGTMAAQTFTAGVAQNLSNCNFTREGYTFDGWATAANGAKVYDNGASVTDLASAGETTTLYAHWTPNTYTVTFDKNGGEGDQMDNQVFTYDVAQNLRECTYSRSGNFAFDGWAISPDGAKVYNPGQSVSNLTAEANGTVTLYAHWAETQNVTYTGGTHDVNADTNISGDIIITGDVTLIVSAALTVGEIRPDGGGSLTLNVLEGGSITAGTIEAHVFNMSGGTVNVRSIVASGGSISGGRLTVTDNGHGFFTASASSTLTISGGVISADEVILSGNTIINATDPYLSITANSYNNLWHTYSLTISGRSLIDGDGTIYAADEVDVDAIAGKTLRPAYTVTFDENGGSNVSDLTVAGGSTISDPGSTKTGYTATWKKGEDVYNFSSPVTEDFTLTATWTANTYSVRFYGNGGDGSMDYQSFTYDEAAKALTANTFTREGYVFAGWATTVDGAVAYTDGAEVQNLTAEAHGIFELYAQWKKLMTNDDISASVPDQTLEGPNNLFENINYKFEYANNNYSESYAQEFITGMGVDIKDGETALSLGTDYRFGSVTYANGDPITTSAIDDECKVEIVGLGNYAGSTWASFKIKNPSGEWGGLTWSLASDGTLTISGTGTMINAVNSNGYGFPWFFDYRSDITAIVIGEGITSIANKAFGAHTGEELYGNVTSITLPSTLTTIGSNAFDGCNNLAIDLSDIPANVSTIGDNAFNNVLRLTATLTALETGSSVERLSDVFKGYHVDEVRFKRSFTSGVASTICLPFQMGNIDGGKVYEFVGVEYDETDGWVATMKDETPDPNIVSPPTTVGKPYLFMPSATGEVTFRGVITDVPEVIDAGTSWSNDENWWFYGTYSRLAYGTAPFDDPVFGFAANDGTGENAAVAGEFVRADDGAFIRAFRAFLKYDNNGDDNPFDARATRGGAGVPDRITVRLIGKSGEIDGIGEIRLSTGEVTFDSNAWYDLNGRKLTEKPTQKGIYINNGHKIAIK